MIPNFACRKENRKFVVLNKSTGNPESFFYYEADAKARAAELNGLWGREKFTTEGC